MSEQLGMAIIGCGYWGINYVRLFSELPESRVVIACDPRVERLQEIGKRFPGVALTTNLDDVLRLETVDAVAVCTGAVTHYDITRKCLEAGKHILVEKPMTTKEEDAGKLIALANSQKLTLMVGHTFLYNPGVRKVKQYIEQTEIGQVYYLYAKRTNLGPIRHDVNALWDLAPHDISIFNYLLDDMPEWVSAVGAKVLRNAREDVGFVTLGYKNGVIGHIHVSWADPNKVRETVVVGSSKRIVFNDLNPLEQVRVFEKGIIPHSAEPSTSYGEYHFSIRDGDIISPRIEISEPLKNQGKHFLDCVTRGQQPLSDGQAGLEVVQVMQAIDRSVAQNGTPISLKSNSTPTSIHHNGAYTRIA